MDLCYLGVELAFVCTDPAKDTDEGFDAFTNEVMDALLDLEEVDSGITDPDITASLTERTMSVVMGIEADTERDALRLFSANLRTALHAVQCSTADWPDFRLADDELPPASKVDFADA